MQVAMKLMMSTYCTPGPRPSMPEGLVELMEGLTREVLRENPSDVYAFCARHMQKLVEIRDGIAPKSPMSLERKIARARERVRKKAEERRRKFDEEMIKLMNKNTKGEKATCNGKKYDKEPIQETFGAPVNHNLSVALEVEIPHKTDNNSLDKENKRSNKEHFGQTTNETEIIKLDKNETILQENLDDITDGQNIEDNLKFLEATGQSINETNQNTQPIPVDSDKTTVKIVKYKDLQSYEEGNSEKEERKYGVDNAIVVESKEVETVDIVKGKTVNDIVHENDVKADFDDDNDINRNITVKRVTNETSEENPVTGYLIKNRHKNNERNEQITEEITKTAEEDIEPKSLLATEKKLQIFTSAENQKDSTYKKNKDLSHNMVESIKSVEGIAGIKYIDSERTITDINSGKAFIKNVEKLEVAEKSNEKVDNNENNSDENSQQKPKSPVFDKNNDSIFPEQIQICSSQDKNTESEAAIVDQDIKKGQNFDTPDHCSVAEEQGTTTDSGLDSESNINENIAKFSDLSKTMSQGKNPKEKEGIIDPIMKDDQVKVNNINIKMNKTLNTENHSCTQIQEKQLPDSNIEMIDDIEKKTEDVFSKKEISKKEQTDFKDMKNDVSNILEPVPLISNAISVAKSKSMDSIYESNNDILTEELDADESTQNSTNSKMDLETAAITIQKVFRTFLFKSRGSTFEDTNNDETNFTDEEDKLDKEKILREQEYLNTPLNLKDRRTLGVSRMDTVLQTVNEEKSLSLSTDDSSTLSSAATVIQSHVRGFLVRNRLKLIKTSSTISMETSDGPSSTSLENDDIQKSKTILNIRIVPEGEHFLSRDESIITSMDMSLDGSPPSSSNLHPLGYDKSERRRLHREDAIQSVSPPSNNSGKLSEDVDSIKEILVTETSPEIVPDDIIELINDEMKLETLVEDYKDIKDNVHCKMRSVENIVASSYMGNKSTESDHTLKLLHSGEFHDVVLPTKVLRSDTTVVRDFKNVLVYFLLWK